MEDENEKNEPKVQAAHNGIAVGGISIGRDLSGTISIGHGYTAEQVSVLLKQITTTLQPKKFDGRCPYKGLEVFEEEDAELFFGRERLLNELVGRVKESRTVFITGPSGSGKSSLVRAGLIHALKQGSIKSSDRWLYETMKPGREPIKDLALAFSRLKSPELEDYFLKHAGETDVLNKCTESVLSGRKDQRFVLFIDQFEEVFTQVSGEEDRVAFINMLAHAGTIENGRVTVLFAMRSDFVSNCATYPALNELLSQEFRQIGAMQPDELVSAIALPARHVGLPIEDELIARIINDMKGEPGALPLMQFALKDLFDSQQEKGGVIALTLKDYLQHGGIHKSLERHADNSFAKLSEAEQGLARSIFSGLIEIGRGAPDTKRTAWFEELIPVNVKAEDVGAIVQKLADARLIITDEQAGKDTVTISHEKLIEAWPWLKKLVTENRDVIDLQNLINEDAQEWSEHAKDASYLYSGARLAAIEEKSREIVLSEKAQAFVKASIDARETNRRRAERTRRSLAAMLITVALIMTGLAGFAWNQSIQAKQAAQTARIGQLAALAVAKYQNRIDLSLLLSVETFNFRDNYQTRGALMDVLRASPYLRQFVFHHTDIVWSVAFSPDGKTLASGSADHSIMLWDVASGQSIAQLLMESAVVSVAFSPDGKVLASVGEDGSIILWDLATHQQLGVPIIGYSGVSSSMAFSPDGKLLAYGSYDGTIIMWDVASGQPVDTLPLEHPISSMAFSPDGKLIAYGSNDRTIILWDLPNRKQLGEPLSGHIDGVLTVAFSPDGRTLASGSFDRSIILWDVESRRQLGQPLTGHTEPVFTVAFSPDGKTLASGSEDRNILLWNVESHQRLGEPLTGHSDSVWSVVFSPDGASMASGSRDNNMILWDLSNRQQLGEPLTGHSWIVWSIAFSPDGKTLASGSLDSSIILWDVTNRQPLGEALTGHTSSVLSVTFNPDGMMLASGSSDGSIIFWDVTSREQLGEPLTGHSGDVSRVAFSPDGKILASGSEDSSIILWDVASRQQLGEPLTGHAAGVLSLAFSPDGSTLASGSRDRSIILWDVEKRRQLGEPLAGHSDAVWSVAFSPDGKTLASGGEVRNIFLWDVTRRQRLGEPFTGFAGWVSSIAFSPDGKTLASGSLDHSILWDVASRQQIGEPLTMYTSWVRSVAFSPDGKTLASGTDDRTVILWDLDPESWLQRACSIVGRNFTEAEWRQYFPNEAYRKTCAQWP